MTSKLLRKFSKCLFFLSVCFLVIFSSILVVAQDADKHCQYLNTRKFQYNLLKQEWEWVDVYELVCVPVSEQTKSADKEIALGISTFSKIWIDHDVFENKEKGMRIHATFNLRNLKNKKCKANVSVKNVDPMTVNFADFMPQSDNDNYEDLKLFVPYPNPSSRLSTSKSMNQSPPQKVTVGDVIDGTYDKRFELSIEITCEGGVYVINRANKYYFDITFLK